MVIVKIIQYEVYFNAIYIQKGYWVTPKFIFFLDNTHFLIISREIKAKKNDMTMGFFSAFTCGLNR